MCIEENILIFVVPKYWPLHRISKNSKSFIKNFLNIMNSIDKYYKNKPRSKVNHFYLQKYDLNKLINDQTKTSDELIIYNYFFVVFSFYSEFEWNILDNLLKNKKLKKSVLELI